jgi:Ni,Fe-hydrogenase III small subunit
MAELWSLESPNYSLESYNISFTASPKHADWIFVVWWVSKNMKQALIEAYAVVPEPKVVIACWDKAINWDSRFNEISWSVKSIIWKVDLEIPGNPSSKDIFNYLVNFVK